MLTFAHRGFHGEGVHQNSMEAFTRAAHAGHGIETDLRTTSDGEVVLFHDRCVDGRPVDTMSRWELQAMAGRDVPTLDELLDVDLGVPINLDVKTSDAYVKSLSRMLAARDQIVLVSAFRHELAIAAAAASLPSAYLMASRPQFDVPLPPRRPNLDTIVFDYDVIDHELVEWVRLRNMSVVSYGALTVHENARLRDMGVVATITDRPDHA